MKNLKAILTTVKMRKSIVIMVLMILVTLGHSQVPKLLPQVDERTELLSIVFRLAGAEEYVNDFVPSYSKDIDAWFATYRDHDAVRFARQIRKMRGVSYDAVMSYAICIEIAGSIKFRQGISVFSNGTDSVP